jgi:molecular chaperone HscA
MAEMLIDSLSNAETDIKNRALVEARNEANNVLLSTKKFLTQNAEWLEVDQVTNIGAYAEKLAAAVAGEDKDAINQRLDELNQYSTPLAHEALDRNVSAAIKGDGL